MRGLPTNPEQGPRGGLPSIPVCLVAAGAGLCLFHFLGNATRGYIDTPSLFGWWLTQWVNPTAGLGHAWFVLAASLALLVRNLAREGEPRSCDPAGGLLLLGCGLGLHAIAFQIQQPALSVPALLLFCQGLPRLCGRADWSRASVFPLWFMLFALPLGFLDAPAFWLRLGVAWCGEHLAGALGWEVQRVGTQLSSARGAYHYEVAAACSGLRSLTALAAVSLLIGYVHLRSGFARGLLALLSVPYAFLGNLLRVLMLIGVSELQGRAAGQRIHDWGAWLVYGLVLGLSWFTVPVMARLFGERRPPVDSGPKEAPAATSPLAVRIPRSVWVKLLALLLGAMLLLSWLGSRVAPMQAGVPLEADGIAPKELPSFPCADWAGKRLEPGVWERQTLPADTGYSRKLYLPSGDLDRAILVSLVLSGRDRSSLHRPDLCLTGQGWRIDAREVKVFHAGSQSLELTLLEVTQTSRPRPALVVYGYIGPQGTASSHVGRLWADILGRLQGRSDRWAYVLMQTEMPDGREAALARLEELWSGLAPALVPERAPSEGSL